MTKPLTLMLMILLTVIALGVGYLAYSSASKDSDARGKALAACVNRNLMREDIPNVIDYCRATV